MKDPFREHVPLVGVRRHNLLGSRFEFQSDSRRLLQLVDAAYATVPGTRLASHAPKLTLRLALRERGNSGICREPPLPVTQSGAGFICAVVDTENFAVLCPELGQGLVSVSRDMLRFPYHARYELLEFAVFTLASRAQNLVPLHGACVGAGGRALLLLGDSGAGKSTLTLHCMLRGLDLLAEDAAFVDPRTLMTTGIPNFLHLRRDSLRFIDSPALTRQVLRAPVIRRRSGVGKFEMRLRRGEHRIAARAMKLAGIVFVSRKPAGSAGLLAPVKPRRALKELVRSQAYAAGLRSWQAFAKRSPQIPAFELKRGTHPREGAAALFRLLDWR
jgi:hypothetical protein